MPFFNLSEHRGYGSAFHGIVRPRRRLSAKHTFRRYTLFPLEFLVLDEIHNRSNLLTVELRISDEKTEDGFPEFLVLQVLAKSSGDDGTGQFFAASQSLHLGPTQG